MQNNNTTHWQKVMDQVRSLRFKFTIESKRSLIITNGLAILNKIMVINVKHSPAEDNGSSQIPEIQVYNNCKWISHPE